jgi:hypothetical protein
LKVKARFSPSPRRRYWRNRRPAEESSSLYVDGNAIVEQVLQENTEKMARRANGDDVAPATDALPPELVKELTNSADGFDAGLQNLRDAADALLTDEVPDKAGFGTLKRCRLVCRAKPCSSCAPIRV